MHRRSVFFRLGLLLALAMVFGCGPKRRPEVTGANGRDGGTARGPVDGSGRTEGVEGPDFQSMTPEGGVGQDIPLSDSETGEGGPLADIHFGYDQSSLTPEAQGILEKHALWLQTNRNTRVRVEGHCDDRGTVEYNLALGEQRARAARDYLVQLGVSADRLSTVSYGKERPIDPGNNEGAWAKNRRAHFNVSR